MRTLLYSKRIVPLIGVVVAPNLNNILNGPQLAAISFIIQSNYCADVLLSCANAVGVCIFRKDTLVS